MNPIPDRKGQVRTSDYKGKRHTYLVLGSVDRGIQTVHLLLTTFPDGHIRTTSTTESREERDWDSMHYEPGASYETPPIIFLKPLEKRRTWIRVL